MKLKQAYYILKCHNEWRRDQEGHLPMEKPVRLGIAIDIILKYLRERIEENGD